jgi:hypothetical protein
MSWRLRIRHPGSGRENASHSTANIARLDQTLCGLLHFQGTPMAAVGPLLPIHHIRCEVGSLSKTGPLVLDTRLSHLGRVEMWRGGFRFEHICFPPLSSGGALVVQP